jgi:phenylacetic acid degradation operon negative regulatory protein
MLGAARKAISELGLTSHCSIFTGDYAGGKDLRVLLHEAWDLARVDADYRAFLEQHSGTAETLRSVRGENAFVGYLGIIDEWRRLPYRDPGLPREILPGNWSGPAAAALFEQLVAGLEGHALAHAARYWPS